MPLYTKESLENLRTRIDLVEVISAHVPLHRSGSSYKGLCPFHEEKTPSFIVQRGDSHYHCFGCNAHGDAIAFLMNQLKVSFVEAVDLLAEKFQVVLEKTENVTEPQGPKKADLKEALEKSCQIYHFLLLYSAEGHEALKYLYNRGIDLSFIKQFRVGYAPGGARTIAALLNEMGFDDAVLINAGLMSEKQRDFFSERITFPICDSFGAVIGFSARKFKESTFGGKYINTPETPLFKKSQILFGLNYCRQRIAKEKKALIVEGQIDALRLIFNGLDYVVASQGTAFGEGHLKPLIDLGVTHTYLAFDGDEAGCAAAVKVGNLFQKKGIGVSVLKMPPKADPDLILREQGPEKFSQMLEQSRDYLTFLVEHFSKPLDLNLPAQKNELVQKVVNIVRSFEEPVMIHESLRKLSQLLSVPEDALGISGGDYPSLMIKKTSHAGKVDLDPDRILETDLLRWLILRGKEEPKLIEMVQKNLSKQHLRNPLCIRFFEFYLNAYQNNQECDLMAFGAALESEQQQELLSEIVQKKINLKKSELGIKEVIEKILTRRWMEEREMLKAKIQSGHCTDEEAMQLAKLFDQMKKNPPQVL